MLVKSGVVDVPTLALVCTLASHRQPTHRPFQRLELTPRHWFPWQAVAFELGEERLLRYRCLGPGLHNIDVYDSEETHVWCCRACVRDIGRPNGFNRVHALCALANLKMLLHVQDRMAASTDSQRRVPGATWLVGSQVRQG